MDKMAPHNEIAVVPARFQCADISASDLSILEQIIASHNRTILLIMVARAGLNRLDPLDYVTREAMLRNRFQQSGVSIAPLKDCRTDAEWSRRLDAIVRDVAPLGQPLVYPQWINASLAAVPVAQDAFRGYCGSFSCSTADLGVDGTDSGRRAAGYAVRWSSDFRAGMIYAAHQQHPRAIPTVDVAIVDWDRARLCLGRKPGEYLLRFIGGFYDSTVDTSHEMAGAREAYEETQLSVGPLKYVASIRVDDWRYPVCDRICTTLFVADYAFGAVQAADDIEETKWVNFADFTEETLIEEHRPLYEKLRAYMDKEVVSRKAETQPEK